MHDAKRMIGIVCAAGLALCGFLAFSQQAEGGHLALEPAGWSTPLCLSTATADAHSVDAVVDSQGRLHVVWSEAGSLVHLWRQNAQWSSPVAIGSGDAVSLAAGPGGQVRLAFSQNDDVHFCSWHDSGGWSVPVNVSDSTDLSASPQIAACADGSLAIAWSEQGLSSAVIYLAESTDGTQWSMAPVPDGYGSRPVLAFAGPGDLWLAWQDWLGDGYSTEIFVTRRVGQSWTMPETASITWTEDSILPTLATAGGAPVVAWQEGAPGHEAIDMAQWLGDAWTVPQRRTESGPAYAPDLSALASGEVNLAWTTAGAVQIVRGSATTNIWQPIETVASGQTEPRSVRLALGDRVHVLWLAASPLGNRVVLYSVSGDHEPTATLTALPASPTATDTATSTPVASATATETLAPPTWTPEPSLTATITSSPTATGTAAPSPSPTATHSGQLWRVSLPLVLRQRR